MSDSALAAKVDKAINDAFLHVLREHDIHPEVRRAAYAVFRAGFAAGAGFNADEAHALVDEVQRIQSNLSDIEARVRAAL